MIPGIARAAGRAVLAAALLLSLGCEHRPARDPAPLVAALTAPCPVPPGTQLDRMRKSRSAWKPEIVLRGRTGATRSLHLAAHVVVDVTDPINRLRDWERQWNSPEVGEILLGISEYYFRHLNSCGLSGDPRVAKNWVTRIPARAVSVEGLEIVVPSVPQAGQLCRMLVTDTGMATVIVALTPLEANPAASVPGDVPRLTADVYVVAREDGFAPER